MYIRDTIAAIATAPGEGGIGIVRISGPEALAVAARLFQPAGNIDWQTVPGYTAHYGHIRDEQETVDECVLLVMRAPRSYTGEDTAELQIHGGTLVLRRVLQLCLQAGCRAAESGEFTERAFLNGRLDLAQAEAVQDIITARSNAGLDIAVRQLNGSLSRWVAAAEEEILTLVSSLEAAIDYPEEDLAELGRDEVAERLANLCDSLRDILARTRAGKVWREGLRTVISGLPNAGKSSLLNLILREERAIVTEIPGTTRDIIAEYADLHGILLHLIDTAGIRETTDTVERIGVDRARREAAQAELILAVLDGSEPVTEATEAWLRTLVGKPVILLWNKADLPLRADTQRVREIIGDVPEVSLSARAGDGLTELGRTIYDFVGAAGLTGSHAAMLTNVRQQQWAETALEHLEHAATGVSLGLPEDCLTEDLRQAREALAAIVGRRAGSDIVSEIFRRFCVGK